MNERVEPKKRPRTLTLSVDVETKLLKLCEQLGVNPHAYLVNEVGKAVNRDYLQFETANIQRYQMNDFMTQMHTMVLEAMKEESKRNSD